MHKILITLTSLFLLFSSAHATSDNAAKQVVLETSEGNIVLELDMARAPLTVDNFLKHVNSGHYNGTIFHRVIKDFMIQGGGFTPELQRKEGTVTVMNEADNGLSNLRGTIAMARTNDPHSASAQFFINVVDNPFLDHKSKTIRGWGYAVFGHVVKGMNVVDKIRNIRTGPNGPFSSDVPLKQVIIHKASVIETADNTKK